MSESYVQRSSTLNQQQLEAVKCESPLLIIAGAGSGKTTVIVNKIAELARKRFILSRIAAITFTNKAANEMRKRSAKMLGEESAGQLNIGTFHALGLQIIRQHHDYFGLRSSFSLFDDQDFQQQLKEILGSRRHEALKGTVYLINHWKNQLILPHEASTTAKEDIEHIAAGVYAQYEEKKQGIHCVDFNDLILYPVQLLSSNNEAAAKWKRHFQHVLVDEYQDTNSSQNTFFELLVSNNQPFTLVGDDDQSVYAWRGASSRNMLELDSRFSNLKTIVLDQNYRSTNEILSMANKLIAGSEDKRIQKKLWSNIEGGSPVQFITAQDSKTEANRVLESIRTQRFLNNQPWSDFCILYRSNWQSEIFEQVLRQYDIPYQVSGSKSFFDRIEVKDVIAYLQLIANFNNDQAFLRIINKPSRKIGEKALQKLASFCSEHDISLMEGCNHPNLSYSVGRVPYLLFRGFYDWVVTLARFSDIVELVHQLLKDIDYMMFLQNTSDSTKQFESRERRVHSLIGWIKNITEKHQGLDVAAVLMYMHISEKIEDQNQKEGIRLMTIHAAKGLEFPFVFITGLEEGLLPHKNSIEGGSIEEERRLMYVAITRAKYQLTLSRSQTRKTAKGNVASQPSRFLREVEPETPQPMSKEDRQKLLKELKKRLQA